MPSITGGRYVWPKCACEVAAYEAERLAYEEMQARQRIERYYGTFQMPERFLDRTIDTFRPVDGSRTAYEASKRYIDTLPVRLSEGAGMLLWGTNGNGKTHLAAATFHAAKAIGASAIFVCVPELFKRLKATFDEDSRYTEHELTAPLMDAKLLVLDDLGQEKASAWVQEKLFTVINARYEAKRSIVVTTNRTPEQLEDRIGRASLDRLMGLCRFFEVTAPSRRWDEAPNW